MVSKRIQINLSDADAKFVKWYAERDGISFIEELQRMLYVAIEDEKMIYGEEFESETGIDPWEY